MADIKLSNERLAVEISLHGAELKSLKRLADDREYLWCGDPTFWGRTSPVLFPFIGSVKDKIYRHNGREYPMGQHGFARDRRFSLVDQTNDTVWFSLEDDANSRQVYPFFFRLEIGYRLEADGVNVMWNVKNNGTETLHFSIGAHPAFSCPTYPKNKEAAWSFSFQDGKGQEVKTFRHRLLGQGGTVTDRFSTVELPDGKLPITERLFDIDTFIIEEHQVQKVALTDATGREQLAVEFDAPLVGLWSPPGKCAPFVCIEPWYGRCDSETFTGELKDRQWSNHLEAGEVFEANYKIMVK